jgi:hypothetical protein
VLLGQHAQPGYLAGGLCRMLHTDFRESTFPDVG